MSQNDDTSNHDAILCAFQANSNGTIPDSAYTIQRKVDAFLHTSTAWKRGQLLDEFLRDHLVLVTALACKGCMIYEVCILI